LSTLAANFRDVMIALGLYPDEDAVMGIEASGVVLETSSSGSSATSFVVGDRVMGLFPEGTARSLPPTTDCSSRCLRDGRTPPPPPCRWFSQPPITRWWIWRASARAAGIGARGGRGRRHGRGAAGQAPGVGGIRHRQPRQVGHPAGHGFSTTTTFRIRAAWTFEDKFRAVTAGRGVDVVLDSFPVNSWTLHCVWWHPAVCS